MDPVLEAVRRYGTPLYWYDDRILQDGLRALRDALRPSVEVWYALKANPAAALLERMRPRLDGADVASRGELRAALAAGFAGADLGFTGPAKRPEDLAAAVAAEATVCLEAIEEVDELADAARAAGRPARALLRINPPEVPFAFRVKTAGGPGPFGIPSESVGEAMARVRAAQPWVDVRGVHVHAGSQCASVAAWLRHADATLQLAAALADAHGVPLEHIDLGGGFPVSDRPFDVAALGRKLSGRVEAFRAARGPVRVVVEPGRFVTAPAGRLVARVVRRREVRGETFVVLDAGMHALLFQSEAFGGGPPPRVRALSPAAGSADVAVRLVGPSCTPLDSFGTVTLPDPRPGDLLAFEDVGAYGFSASPHQFLLHGPPAQVLWDGAEMRAF